jgi:citrate lyase subunit alpha / citrate CoA-transferase
MTRMNAAMREIPLELPGMEKLQPFVGAWAMHPQSSRKLLSAGRPSKVLGSLDEAIRKSGLESGMTVSFHHHFREGDCIVNLVMEAIARAGLRDMTLAASSLTSVHAPLKKLCERGVIRRIYTSGLRGALADAISRGMMDLPVVIQSHGGRARALLEGSLRPDVAFLGVPSCDGYGNARGWTGKSACGSLGYAMVDARVARTVVLLTDSLEGYPVAPASIGQVLVDWVVPVESVGDPKRISVGATRMTRDPRELLIARRVVEAMDAAGVIHNGFSFQTGSGGSSLAAVRFLRQRMLERKVKAAFALGGITSQTARMLEEELVGALFDVQSFDMEAARSLGTNANHFEMDASFYANPDTGGPAVDLLDSVILSALEIDTAFNVNVITGSDGVIRGASGGHSDTAAGSSLTIVVAPLVRARTASIVPTVDTLVTPGETVDLVVTDRGTAVNPRRADLRDALAQGGIPTVEIEELAALAERITGKPEPVEHTDRVIGVVEYRDGTVIDVIRQVKS